MKIKLIDNYKLVKLTQDDKQEGLEERLAVAQASTQL